METATVTLPPRQSSDSLSDAQPYDIDDAMRKLRSQLALLRKYFPDVPLDQLERSMDQTESDLKQHARRVAHPGSSPGETSASVAQAKRLTRASFQEDLHQALQELRAAHPSLSVEHLLALLKKKRPLLWAEVQRIEAASAQEGD